MAVITGTIANDTLAGSSTDDTLNGGLGIDTMSGGAGNDTYIVDQIGDLVVEGTNAGIDTVKSSLSTYTLLNHVENLTLTGTALNGIGNTLNNVLLGNSSNNSLQGFAGNDVLYGYEGNDTLDGGTGIDTLYGGNGNDVYVIDTAFDVVSEVGTTGTDTVVSSANYTLGTNVENLTLAVGALTGTGNALNNVLIGNGSANTLSAGDGNDTLNGGTGIDTLYGGNGNDVYVIETALDVVSEVGTTGTDTVVSSVNYMLGANVENLTLAGTALTGTGNTLNNVLVGSASANILSAGDGNDTLDGGAGSDTLYGGNGNDVYVIDTILDVVSEATTIGMDTVISSVNYTLGTNVENLTLTGTASTGIGNTLNNVLLGNGYNNNLQGLAGNDILYGYAGNDSLDGGIGADTLFGGAGNDSYFIDSLSDIVTEAVNEGTDTVNSAVSYALGANVENLTLTGAVAINGTGNSLNNILIGNTGNNTLQGGLGNDTLAGGSGNDVYKYAIGDGNDVIIANSTNSLDTIEFGTGVTGMGDLSFNQLGNDLRIDINTATGVGSIYLQGYYTSTGNKIQKFTFTDPTSFTTPTTFTLIDVLIGSSAVDTIVTSESNKVYVGNAGNDVAIVSGSNNVIYGGADNDNCKSTGTNNRLYGGSGNDTLEGGSGKNNLNGGGGNDLIISSGFGTLTGRGGNDTYIIKALTGDMTIDNTVSSGDNGTDILNITALGKKSDFTYTKATSSTGIDLKLTKNSTGKSIILQNWYSNTGSRVENIMFSDGTINASTLTSIATPAITRTGTTGADTYTFDLGVAQNLIIGSNVGNSLDTLKIQLNSKDIPSWMSGAQPEIRQNGNDLFLALDEEHTVTLKDWWSTDTRYRVSTIEFALPVLNLDLKYSLRMGNSGNDVMLAGSAGELMLGFYGNDNITGGNGNDMLFGDNGNDTLAGNGGIDVLAGGDGNDILNGGDGNDILMNSTGTDMLTGGSGNDVYYMDLGEGYTNGYFGKQTITSSTANKNDTVAIDVAPGGQWISTTYGGYWQTGLQHNQVVASREGITNNLLLSVKNSYNSNQATTPFLVIQDWYKGGDYKLNHFSFDGDGEYSLSADGKTWTAYTPTTPTSTTTTVTPTDAVQTWTYTPGQGSLIIGKQAKNNLDTLKIAIDPSKAYFSDWSPEVTTSSDGKDLILAVDDSSKLTLKGWFESPAYQIHNLDISMPGTGALAGLSIDLAFSMVMGQGGNDTLTGTSGGEFMIAGDGNDLLLGLAGDDIITGDYGNDRIDGGDGDDILHGGQGNDSLFGGLGSDVLEGSQGRDTLTGGAGNDTYLVGSYGTDNRIAGVPYTGNLDIITADTNNGNDAVCFTDGDLRTSDLLLSIKDNNLLITQRSQEGFYTWNPSTQQPVYTTQTYDEQILQIQNFGAGSSYQPTFKFLSDNSTHKIVLNGTNVSWS